MFYGWWIVFASAAGLAVHFGPILASTFGIFLLPLESEFGWSRSEISIAFSLALLGVAFAQPFTGRMIDKYGARPVILASAILMGLSIASLYLLPASLFYYYLLFFLLGCLASGSNPVPFAKVVSRWFDRRRGLALALAISGSSIGVAVMPPVAQWLIGELGWRVAYVVLGLIVIAVMVPTTGFLLRDSPEPMNLHPDGVAAHPSGGSNDTAGFSRPEAFRMFNFWALVIAFITIAIAFHACLIHLVPMLRDSGMSAEAAAGAASLLGVGILVGRIATGFLLDRFFAPHIAIAVFFVFSVAIALLWYGGSLWLVYVAVVLLGLAQGAEFDLMAYMVSRYFGLASFAEIYSFIFAAFNIGGVIGPTLMGIGYDATGAYTTGLAILVVMPFLAITMFARLGQYPSFVKAD